MLWKRLTEFKLTSRILRYFFPRPERPLASSRGFTDISPYGAVLAPDIW